MRKILLTLMSLVLMMLPGVAVSTELVVNGGFETGLSGWTFTPASVGSDFNVSDNSHSGDGAASFGAVGNFDDSISQALSTIPGQSYNLTFWLAHNSTNSENDFHVSWGGSSVLDLINVASFGYTEYSYTEVAPGSPTILQFSGREVPAWFYLDDVSVTGAAAPVPEPATMLLVGSGLIGLAAYARRKFKK